VEYFTGFEHLVPEEREALVIVTSTSVYLIKAAFSPFQPGALLGTEHLVRWEDPRANLLPTHLKHLLELETITQLQVDIADLRVTEYQALQEVKAVQIKALEKKMLWQQRLYKDEHELAKLQQSAEIIQQCLAKLPRLLQAGITEKHLAQQLENLMREQGASGPAFPTIVAFGANAALPHHQPGETVLTPQTPVLVDLGAKYARYCSDFTRTLWFGAKPSPQFLAVEQAVHNAYQASWKTCQAGQKAQDVDTAARQLLVAAGWGKNFIHTTGHGLGLEIHEPPSLSSQNLQVLGKNMVITLEPGLYFPGEFGYRYENTVWLSDEGPVELGET
jgi:Xaa-Pro aminopeptidase